MIRILCALIASALSCSAPVYAHVQVFADANNEQIASCTFAKFVVRVPVERPVPTVRIDLAIPNGVKLFAVEPKTGWKYALQTNRGLITRVSWTGRLLPRQFEEFAFLAATPKMPGSVSWDAWQRYEDGKVVSWTGGPGADTPHSITAITQGRCRQ